MSIEIDPKKEKTPLDPDYKLQNETQKRFKKEGFIPSLYPNIYLPFKQWLNSKKAVTFEDALEDIYDNLLPHLKYDKTEDWLNSEIEVKRDSMTFKDFYHHNDFSKNWGDCKELSNKLAFLIKEKYPALSVAISMGQDDKFFSGQGQKHFFPIISLIQDKDEIFKSYIVDPTYQKIINSKDSNYKINQSVDITTPFYTDIVKTFYTKDNEVKTNFSGAGTIVYPVIIDRKADSILCVGILHNNQGGKNYLKTQQGLSSRIVLEVNNQDNNTFKIYNIQDEMHLLKQRFKDQKTLEFIDKFVEQIQNYKI